MNLSLCSNCVYSSSCNLRNEHLVLECEEHFSKEEQHSPDSSIEDFREDKLKYFTGLCDNCERRDDCLWRNDKIITFHCEHYQ